jgi:myo-inositol 2-dehydrogenase / D-chiro-inositol 1-dehydrogenase
VRVAVVGAGNIGGFHAAQLAGLPGVDGLMVVDADPARASTIAKRTGARVASFDDVLSGADAVVIATPPELHAADVRAAIESGLHVLCEKPLTDTLASSIELTREIEAGGAHVEVGFQRRHDAGFVRARKVAAAGRIHELRLTAHDPLAPRAPEPAGPWPEVAPMFRDSSIHDFDMARWISDAEVVEVFTLAGHRDGRRPHDPRSIESAVVSMRLASGALAALDASWLHPAGYDVRVEIVGEAAAATGGLSPQTPVGHADWPVMSPDRWRSYLGRFEPAYRAELEAFLACCRGFRPPSATARDGLEAMRIAVAATRSHLDRRPVSLDEIPGLARREVA